MVYTPQEVVTGGAQIVFRLAETPKNSNLIELKLNQADLRLVRETDAVGLAFQDQQKPRPYRVVAIKANVIRVIPHEDG